MAYEWLIFAIRRDTMRPKAREQSGAQRSESAYKILETEQKTDCRCGNQRLENYHISVLYDFLYLFSPHVLLFSRFFLDCLYSSWRRNSPAHHQHQDTDPPCNNKGRDWPLQYGSLG